MTGTPDLVFQADIHLAYSDIVNMHAVQWEKPNLTVGLDMKLWLAQERQY